MINTIQMKGSDNKPYTIIIQKSYHSTDRTHIKFKSEILKKNYEPCCACLL